MKKTMTNAKPALDVTGLSDDDLLEHLNALHDGMLNTPSYSDPTVDMAGLKAAIDALAVAAADARTGGKAAIIERDKRRAEAIAMFCRFGDANLLPEPRTFVDTVGTLSTTQTRDPSLRVRPLVCSTKSGDRYIRPPAVQDEIRRVLRLPRAQCIAERENLKNDTLVFLTRLTHQSDDDMCGRLMQELRKRIKFRASKFCSEMDDYDAREFVLNVEIQVLEYVLTKERSRTRDILEVAFGRTVKRLAKDAFKKFKKSVAGNIEDLAADSTGEDWDGEEVDRPMEFLPDVSFGPEDSLLQLDFTSHRHRQLQKALAAIEDPRHRLAVILHHGHDIPITSCRRGQKCLTRVFRKDARQIKHWIATAMKQMRAALGIATQGVGIFRSVTNH